MIVFRNSVNAMSEGQILIESFMLQSCFVCRFVYCCVDELIYLMNYCLSFNKAIIQGFVLLPVNVLIHLMF